MFARSNIEQDNSLSNDLTTRKFYKVQSIVMVDFIPIIYIKLQHKLTFSHE